MKILLGKYVTYNTSSVVLFKYDQLKFKDIIITYPLVLWNILNTTKSERE